MSRLISFALLFFISLTVSAQQKDSLSIEESPGLALKFSPLHVFAFYPTIQLALEHRLYKHIGLQYDVGLVVGTNSESDLYRNASGFKLKTEIRYYVNTTKSIDSYLALEAHASKVEYNRSSVFGIGCATGDCDYFEYKTFTIQNKIQGTSLKMGFLIYLGNQENFFIDLNLGVSLRDIRFQSFGKPKGTNVEEYTDNLPLFAPPEKDRREFAPIIGYRVGYRFK
jgi:hypothetical protein